MSALLTLSGVHTHIGRYHILQGVDFAVPEGATTMLLGRNGAGKTTTLRTIMGLWRASAGTIRFAGRGIEKDATPDISRAGFGLCAGDDGGLLRSYSARKSGACGTRRGARRDAAQLDFRLLPGAEKILAVARRHVVRRPETDAVDRARDGRAAASHPDRRANQGPCPGDRRRARRVPYARSSALARPSFWSSRTSASRKLSATMSA